MPNSDELIEDVSLIENEQDDLEEHLEAITNPDEFYAKRAFCVIYQTNNFFLPQVKDLIEARQIINIRPEYQRRLRWTTPQKSKLIESLLLNIPIPSIYLFESEAARYEVMDGQQRLNAIKQFLNNEFRLSSLNVLWPLNGLTYKTCPPRMRRGLDRAAVSAIVLLLESDVESVNEREGGRLTQADIRRFIFERLNTGGTSLNAQELRNAIYPGFLNDTIIELARSSLFTRIWGIPSYTEADPNEYYENPARQKNRLYSTMGDCQIVLRFFALRDERFIRGSMKSILDECLNRGRNCSQSQATQLRSDFQDRLEFANDLFDGHPFELLPDVNGNLRLSIALYDGVMVAIDRLWARRESLRTNRQQAREAIAIILRDPEREGLITGQGNTAQSVKDRIALITEAFTTCL